MLRSVPCMSRAPLEQPVDGEDGMEQAEEAVDVSSADSEKMRFSTAMRSKSAGLRRAAFFSSRCFALVCAFFKLLAA